MSQDTPTAASAAATEATYTEVPPATSSPGSGAGDDCIASSATRSTLSRTNPRPGATRTPSRSDSVRDSHRRGAPERSYIAISLLSHPRVHMERPPRPTGRWSLPTNPDTRRSLAHFATSHPDRVMTTIRTGETVAARCLPGPAGRRGQLCGRRRDGQQAPRGRPPRLLLPTRSAPGSPPCPPRSPNRKRNRAAHSPQGRRRQSYRLARRNLTPPNVTWSRSEEHTSE